MYRNLFKFDAAVDWLELEVLTVSPKVAWRIQRAGKGAFSYVTGLDPVTGQDIEFFGAQGKNTPTTRFAIRMQAPERCSAIISALATVSDLDVAAPVLLRAIEVAFDAYRQKDTTNAQLAHMVTIMLHQINRPEGSNEAPRFYSWKGTPELRYGKQQAQVAILDSKTAMYGNRDDDYIVRGYLKDYDTHLGENNKLRRCEIANTLEHRARIEVRLAGELCPVETLDDLKNFKFESLARFFKFREPADDIESLERLVADKTGSLGSLIDLTGKTIAAHANKGRPRKSRPKTQASPLNEEARDQLRKLSSRWRCESGRTRRRPYENSGGKRRSIDASSTLMSGDYITAPPPSNRGVSAITHRAGIGRN